MRISLYIALLLSTFVAHGQNVFNFDGKLSGVANWSPQNDSWGLLNGRYLPELNYDWKLDTGHSLYFEASANMYGSVFFYDDSVTADGNILPYRIYARFSGKRYEVRLGLQKIDFGSAMILRPLQWFNEIDPRDPLAITAGVNAVLGRYYFKNNANIWLWGLYGNSKPRGFDLVGPVQDKPEFGGRFQHPVKKGEMAISYNHRTADASDFTINPELASIPEDRIGLDGKWDVGIGLWFETVLIKKHISIGDFTNQTLLTIGTDYTFGLGSGLNVVAEHLIVGFDESSFGFSTSTNTTALSISYPVGFFDNLSLFTTYNWETESASFFLNYQHDFKKITAYLMAYYTPDTSLNLGNDESDFVSSFTGPGLRVMLVFNH